MALLTLQPDPFWVESTPLVAGPCLAYTQLDEASQGQGISFLREGSGFKTCGQTPIDFINFQIMIDLF